eukprot:2043523-Pyramimonas_sp.AAC.1
MHIPPIVNGAAVKDEVWEDYESDNVASDAVLGPATLMTDNTEICNRCIAGQVRWTMKALIPHTAPDPDFAQEVWRKLGGFCAVASQAEFNPRSHGRVLAELLAVRA